MKFATYLDRSIQHVGVLSPDGTLLYPVRDLGINADDMIDLIKEVTPEVKEMLASQLATPPMPGIPLSQVKLLAPIPQPRDVIAVSQNYESHAMETARNKGIDYVRPTHCSYFYRRVNRAVAPDGKILLHPAITRMFDYEVELAVVIGRECRQVPAEQALDYLFGYTICNDFTARDIQKNLTQYGYAKSLDDTTPLGPYIVTADEIQDPHNLQLSLTVNGDLRQNGNTNDLIFDIPYIISDFSKGMTLFPGDIIITGTPTGIGGSLNPPVFLKHGDVVECTVQGLGTLRNVMEGADTL